MKIHQLKLAICSTHLVAASNAVVAAFSELLRFGFNLKICQHSSHHHRSSPRHRKKHHCRCLQRAYRI
ncbi:hypothetical protein HN51_017834 [Arachis hypogaea]